VKSLKPVRRPARERKCRNGSFYGLIGKGVAVTLIVIAFLWYAGIFG